MKKKLLFIPFFLLSFFMLSSLRTQHVYAASPIKTVFIVLMENHDWSSVKGSAAPYITNTLLPMGAHAENDRNGGVHPSAPNYVTLEAGSAVVGQNDCAPTDSGCSSNANHLSKLLDAAKIPWKEYAEDATGTSCILDFSGPDVNHIPFSYFTDVTNNNNPNSANCIAHERPYSELATDLKNNTVARYNFITPNLNDNMHDGTIQQGDTWLSQQIPMIMNSQTYKNGGLIIITWDEDGSGADNPIGLIVLSQYAKKNYSNTIAYSHNSTLRTMEEIFGVNPMLGGAATATDLSDLFTVPIISSTQNPSPPTLTNTPGTVAPTGITPTLFCMGGAGVPPCQNLPSNSPAPSTVPSTAPTGGSVTTISPTQNPCSTTSSSVSIKSEKTRIRKNGAIGNFILQLLQLLIALLQQLLGGSVNIPPIGGIPSSGQPSPSQTPSNPCVSPSVSVSTGPPPISISASPGTSTAPTSTSTNGNSVGPKTSIHYTANSNFSGSTYSPGSFGFNMADVESTTDLANTPSSGKALVWVGLCNGADTTFTSTIRPYIGNPKVFGFYLMDEPDPTGQFSALCTQANLKAESDWIHQNDPGTKTFIISMDMSSSSSPSYANTYNPSNSDIDLYGLDPYPCRTELNGCDYSYITKAVAAAKSSGIPEADIVPVYQTFGLGGWTDDGGGQYAVPTAAQEQQILGNWATTVPNPVFDYAYSWGTQNSDTSLSSLTALQQVFALHNK